MATQLSFQVEIIVNSNCALLQGEEQERSAKADKLATIMLSHEP